MYEPIVIILFYGTRKMSNIFKDIAKKLEIFEKLFPANSLTIFIKT